MKEQLKKIGQTANHNEIHFMPKEQKKCLKKSLRKIQKAISSIRQDLCLSWDDYPFDAIEGTFDPNVMAWEIANELSKNEEKIEDIIISKNL